MADPPEPTPSLLSLSRVATALLALASVVGLMFSLEGRFAKSADVEVIQERLEEKIEEDRADRLQDRIWRLEDRYHAPEKPLPPEIEQEIRSMKNDLERLRRILDHPRRQKRED